MEEVPDDFETVPEEAPPPPEELKREPSSKKGLKDKITCENCSRSMSVHTYRYQHKCKAKTVEEALKPIVEEIPPEPIEEEKSPEPKRVKRSQRLKRNHYPKNRLSP